MKPIACLGLAACALLALSLPASATAFCSIPQTRDGFVALRAGPSPNARLLARMRPGDEVMLGIEQTGRWQQVRYWQGQSRHTDGSFARGRRGWVHGRLLGDNCG